jgi:XTP/dITP diphosphohydrolase
MKLILASNNAGKIREIRRLLPQLEILSLRDIGYLDPIPEPFETFHENARIKAQTIHERFAEDWVLADDSGICVTALKGAPGVFSARFAGEQASDEMNNALLLSELTGIDDRSAWYFAVLCLISPEGAVHYFEGRCDGRIGTELMGEGGFGYDPLFIPAGHEQSFGQLPEQLKGQISHRARALQALVESGRLQINEQT